MERRYITADPFQMSIYEYFHYRVLLSNIPHEKAFKDAVEIYKKQRGEEPVEFVEWYNENYTIIPNRDTN